MSRHGNGDTAAPSLVPAPMLGVIREGYNVFLSVQGTRYTEPEDSTPPMPAVMTTKTAAGGRPTPSPLISPREWSELYRRCLSPLGVDGVNRLWGLVSTVLQILADGGAHTVSAGGAICAWYRAFALDDKYIEEKRQELAALQLARCSEAEIEQIGIFFLDMTERCFFAGAFNTAAALIETLMVALRVAAAFNPFSDDVESCIADIKRLLVASYTDESSFEAWRRDANEQIFQAKRILVEGGSVGRNASACVRVAASVCTVSLNILLAISGDMMLVQQRCLEADLNLLEYLTALCAISTPYTTLRELREVLVTSLELWDADTDNQWLYSIAIKLFGAEALGDMVGVMATVNEVAEECYPWTPEAAYVCATQEEEEDGEEVTLPEEVVNNTCPSAHRFALAFMAAHVADVCAPAVTALSHEVSLTFTRNDLISAYTGLFARHEALWKMAATYVAYSPLANPVLLYNIVTHAARAAALNRAVYLDLCGLFRTTLDPGSPHQRVLRRLLHERLRDHPTLTQWLEMFDHCCREAYGDAHRYIITTRFNVGDAAMAAWLTVETQLPSPLQHELKCLLRSTAALEDDCVYRIGEAVHNSFLALDVCPTPELAHSLSACAAISEYRRAAAALSAMQCDASTPVAAVLKSGAWCLRCVEKTLHRIDACYFTFHPLCVFSLVEYGADTLLAMRAILWKVGSPLYENLAGPILPTLEHALAICRIHTGAVRLGDELRSRESAIAEKLSRAVETHVT